MLRALLELWKDVVHRLDHRLDDVNERRLLAPEQPRMPHGSAKDSPQNIPSTFVRREHAVGKEKRDRSRVIGENTEGRGRDRVGDHVRSATTAFRPQA